MHTLQLKPISVNEAYKGRKFKTPQHKKFKDHAKILLRSKRLPKVEKKQPFFILYHFYTNMQNDLDNLIKLTQDSICEKLGTDDRYIMGMHAKKFIAKKGEEKIKFKIFVNEQDFKDHVQK